MTDRHSTADLVFDEPRQALGWLTTRWAGFLIAVLVWAMMLADGAVALGTWWSVTSTTLVLGSGAVGIWGYWVSTDAQSRLREIARHREVPWWARDRFGTEQAADRLGWRSEPVIWTGRVLLTLAAVATVTGVPVLVLRWS